MPSLPLHYYALTSTEYTQFKKQGHCSAVDWHPTQDVFLPPVINCGP